MNGVCALSNCRRSRVKFKLAKFLHEIPAIRDGLDHLLTHDKVFKRHKIKLEEFAWPYMRPGFPGLVRIVIGQQLSTKAAASLWRRFQDEVGTITPEKILKLSPVQLRALGLSRQKAAYITGLAQAVSDKTLKIKSLEKLDDVGVHDAITSLKGFGPWSAQIYLMFSLARPDIWPHGDLGIQEGMKRYLKLDARPTAMQVLKHGERFAPHRTAASLLLWRLTVK